MPKKWSFFSYFQRKTHTFSFENNSVYNRIQQLQLLYKIRLHLHHVGIYILHLVQLPCVVGLERCDVTYQSLLYSRHPLRRQLGKGHVWRQFGYTLYIHKALYIHHYNRVELILLLLLVVSDHIFNHEYRPAAVIQRYIIQLWCLYASLCTGCSTC